MSDLHRRLSGRVPASVDSQKEGRGMLGFRSRKLEFVDATVKEDGGLVGLRKRENGSQAEEILAPRKKVSPPKLPHKYALLEAFYEGVEAAISLLGIRRQLCTFQSVCATVEATTKRRFLLRHLAQIKYILPESIHLEYVRSYDSDTRSKRWELRISLLPMPAEEEKGLSKGGSSRNKPKVETVQRRRAFHSRLAEFASNHPEEDDVPEHALPERPFNGNLASKQLVSGVQPEFTMPLATTCIPMEINTTAHRHEISETESPPGGSSHFSISFRPSFSSKAAKVATSAGSPLCSDMFEIQDSSEVCSGLLNSVLPMSINRTSHRDVHALAKIPSGTPHLAPSFRPFFSVKRGVAKSLARGNCNDSNRRTDLSSSSTKVTPVKRRHASPEELEVVKPAELSTPIKIIRAGGASMQSETERPNRKPDFSPSFKPHFSARNDTSSVKEDSFPVHDSCGLIVTPVKSSITEKSPDSPDVRTPGLMLKSADHSSPICDAPSEGLSTPVKSSTPVNPFNSPSLTTPSQHHTSPFTPLPSDCGESPINATHHGSLCGSTSLECISKSPGITPVKQGSTIRSLNFATPKGKTQTKSPTSSGMSPTKFFVPSASPGVNVPLTPGMQTPMNPPRTSRFKDREVMKRSKLNLGPVFARNSDDDASASGDEDPESLREDADCREAAEAACKTSACLTADVPDIRGLKRSSTFVSTSAASRTPELRKSLSFAVGDVSEADMSMIQSLPAAFVQSVMEEEMKVAEDRSKDTLTLRHRQQMMAGLPHLFNQLRLIFQSSNRSVFPYKELLSKVLSSNTDMTDRSEVEERLKMILELAPDWISAKQSLAGDVLYRINKNADVMSVRKRLCGVQ